MNTVKSGVKIMAQDKGPNPKASLWRNSKRMEGGEMVGIQAGDYLDSKGTPNGMWDQFNFLPPGQNIDNQEICDIREMEMKQITDLGYPGDGWKGK